MAKDNFHNVEELEIVEEAYDRIDLLVSILEKKGILGKGEYEAKLNILLDKKYE